MLLDMISEKAMLLTVTVTRRLVARANDHHRRLQVVNGLTTSYLLTQFHAEHGHPRMAEETGPGDSETTGQA